MEIVFWVMIESSYPKYARRVPYRDLLISTRRLGAKTRLPAIPAG